MRTEKPIPAEVTKTILESISDGVFTVDLHWRIMSFNKAAEKITGIAREEAIGRYCWEVFRSDMCEGACALRRTMEEEKPFISSAANIVNSNKEKIPIIVSTSLLVNDQNDILGGVETFRDHRQLEELRRELSGGFEFGNMISRSKTMQRLFTILDQVALSDSTVLIQGETGTGKELMARAIHNLSKRKDAPFVGINCGALPDNLLESELFGYRAGAFTDARTDKPGLFDEAEGGTILLDEIGDTSSAFQVRLLRVLEEREFQPLGSTKKIKTNTRIIAATNRDLGDMADREAFRKDLYYRINVMLLNLPPLRERKEDIPLLVERFITKMNAIKDRSLSDIDSSAMNLLLDHDYPGNIRELENIIEHAFILCTDHMITASHLPGYLQRKNNPPPAQNRSITSLEDAERQAIMTALEQNNYNRSATAAQLGIHKSTLFRKIKKLSISLPAKDGRHSDTQAR
ncbi:MAG: Fis family transcriptional regulator [Proteobacteria bacterium]|nr:MAG: Fis family transcriptional regulator [Pseudomonadota bacterium]PIE65487.1 MAG: Fis family transcriptional regulator [Desulfobacterales bacterium]